MPLTPINYENGLIYKIVCNDPTITDIYIGSTTNFIKRKYSHKWDCNNEKSKYYNYYVYQFIRENGGWSNWSLVLIEYYNCNNKLELEKRERYYIEELKATLNKQVPTRTQKEYREDHKEILKEQYKEYYEIHKDTILEKNKDYRETNKDKIKEYKTKKIICECGYEVTKDNLWRHIKTNKHINKIKII
jgi:hypothetical protein